MTSLTLGSGSSPELDICEIWVLTGSYGENHVVRHFARWRWFQLFFQLRSKSKLLRAGEAALNVSSEGTNLPVQLCRGIRPPRAAAPRLGRWWPRAPPHLPPPPPARTRPSVHRTNHDHALRPVSLARARVRSPSRLSFPPVRRARGARWGGSASPKPTSHPIPLSTPLATGGAATAGPTAPRAPSLAVSPCAPGMDAMGLGWIAPCSPATRHAPSQAQKTTTAVTLSPQVQATCLISLPRCFALFKGETNATMTAAAR